MDCYWRGRIEIAELVLFADLHTHTQYSHGTGTIEENVISAINKGFTQIAITDHGLSHIAFGLKKKMVATAREEVDKLNQKYKDKINILFGIESNILSLNGDIDVTKEFEKFFDIIIVGYHNLAKFCRDSFYHFMWKARWSPGRFSKEMIEANTNAFINAINRYKIDIISHPSDPIPVDIEKLAKECAKTGTALEINCKHRSLTENDVEIIKKSGAKIAIDSDAHKPENVGELNFGIELAKKVNFPIDRIINAVQN